MYILLPSVSQLSEPLPFNLCTRHISRDTDGSPSTKRVRAINEIVSYTEHTRLILYKVWGGISYFETARAGTRVRAGGTATPNQHTYFSSQLTPCKGLEHTQLETAYTLTPSFHTKVGRSVKTPPSLC